MDVVYVDLSEAFVTLSHSILLEKLAAQGLGRCALCWVKSCLAVRAQRVVVNGVPSSWQLVTGGVPWAQHWGQFCLVSLLTIGTRGSSAPSVSLQVTPTQVGSVDPPEGRRLCRGTWAGWSDGPRPVV